MLLSLLIVLTDGAPALERVACLGFQRMPFDRLSFRIRRSDGTLSGIGKLISKLHLTNLPHLINVVRGEMSLFGPAPARAAFADRLGQLLPAYIYRYTVKPGVIGWFEPLSSESGDLLDEISRLECDLYYIRQQCPSLDLNILMHALFHRSGSRKQPATVSQMARKS